MAAFPFTLEGLWKDADQAHTQLISAREGQDVFQIPRGDTYLGIPATDLYGRPDFAVHDAEKIEPRRANCDGPAPAWPSGGGYDDPWEELDLETDGCGNKYLLLKSMMAMADLWAFNVNLEALQFPSYTFISSTHTAAAELAAFALDVVSIASTASSPSGVSWALAVARALKLYNFGEPIANERKHDMGYYASVYSTLFSVPLSFALTDDCSVRKVPLLASVALPLAFTAMRQDWCRNADNVPDYAVELTSLDTLYDVLLHC